MYYSEYNVLMYGWFVFKNFYTGKSGGSWFSKTAKSVHRADIDVGIPDSRKDARIFTTIAEILGI